MNPPASAARWNPWPLGIAVALALFAGLLVALVWIAQAHRSELVARDYYEQEVRYQGQIDRLERTRQLTTPLRVLPDAETQEIRITLPPEHLHGDLSGRIRLYRPSAANLDRDFALAPDAVGCQRLDARSLAPGLWKVRVEWSTGGKEYFTDQKVVLPARPS